MNHLYKRSDDERPSIKWKGDEKTETSRSIRGTSQKNDNKRYLKDGGLGNHLEDNRSGGGDYFFYAKNKNFRRCNCL